MATTKRLSATITIGGAVSGTLKAAFGEVKGKLGEVGKTITDLTKRQKLLGKAIQEFGRAGKDVDGLRNSYSRLTAQIDRARAAQKRLQGATDFKEKAGKVGGVLKDTAVRSGAAGAVIGGVLYSGIRQSVNRENSVNAIRNSGVSSEEATAMVKAAENSRQFGVSITKATDTVSELRTALGTVPHAIEALPTALKAISGLQLYDRLHHTDMAEGDSAYQMAKVADERGGAADPEAMREKYNWAFKAITGSNGKVTVGDLLTSVRAGKGAARAMDDEAFFGDTFLQQSMGAPRYGTASSTLVNAWIGGHQKNSAFDHMLQMGLLNKSGVHFDKNGLVKTVEPDALVDSRTFLKDPQKWVDEHLTPLAQKRGVNVDDPAAVMAFVNSITSNPNAANLLLMRILSRNNIWKDRRNVNQANDIAASDQMNQNSTGGKEENVSARLNDAQTRVGNVLLPAFATAMEKTADALEAVNKFADDNPRLMKGIVIGVGGLAVGLVTLAPVLLAANGILQTIALVRLARATAEVTNVVNAMNGVEGAASSAGGGILGFIGKLGLAVTLVGVALAAAKALGLPDTDAKKGADDIKKGNWLAASADLPAGTFLRAMAARTGGKSNDEIAASITGGQNPTDAKAPPPAAPKGAAEPTGAKAPPPAAPKGATAPTTVVHTNDTYNLSIMQQPNQDTKALTDEIMKRLNQNQAKQSRSIMFDGASQ